MSTIATLTAKPLSANVRRHTALTGIRLPDSPTIVKIALYADDITCYVSLDNEWTTLKEMFGIYAKALGSELNLEKPKVSGSVHG